MVRDGAGPSGELDEVRPVRDDGPATRPSHAHVCAPFARAPIAIVPADEPSGRRIVAVTPFMAARAVQPTVSVGRALPATGEKVRCAIPAGPSDAPPARSNE